MSNILGMWIALGKRQTGTQLETSYAWPDLDIACPIPQKRVKDTSFGVGSIEESAGAELLCEESTQASTDSSGLASRIEQLKLLFLELCIEDQLDLVLYRSLDAEQKEIVDSILAKRYKESLITSLQGSNFQQQKLDTYPHMRVKRMDHSEKSILSMQLTMLRDKFKSEHYGTSRPKDLHDAINKQLFRKYFDGWMDPDQLIPISSASSPKVKNSGPPEMLPRHAAIFCMKKGLTKFWFKAVSSKFLEAVSNIGLKELIEYCRTRFSLKIDEIFADETTDPDAYFLSLAEKIKNPKFKLPLTLQEIAYSQQKVQKKLLKLKKITEESELEEFKTHFGAATYKENIASWKGGVSNMLGSSL